MSDGDSSPARDGAEATSPVQAQVLENKRRVTSSMVTATVAGFVGILALGVSAYQVLLEREQARISVMPILGSYTSWGDGRLSVSVLNRGLGPAFVRDVFVSVDGEARGDWPEVYRALLPAPSLGFAQQMISGDVLAPGDNHEIVAFGGDSILALRRMSDRIALRICYCSVFEDCWEHGVSDLLSHVTETTEVDRCDGAGASGF